MASEDHNGEVVSTEVECPDCSTTARERSFDELAKGLANGKLSRRGMLGMLGGALLGGALASIPGVAWAAKPGCASGVTCKGKCCPVGATCAKGAGGGCTCPTGQTVCSGQCVSLTTNQNCGSCGNACSGGKTCQSGACACPQGQTACGGVCRDLATDVANCGQCGNACAQGASCVGGQCACPSGLELCAGTNRCVQGCSATSGEVFNPTTCQCECPTGTTLCPGNNSCVQNCPQGQTLNATTCQCENIVCPGGTVLCDGQCVSTSCSTGEVFNPTTCQCEACPAGQEPCGGQCVQSCSGGRVLNPTTCECECPTGTTLCNGNCVDLQSDANNCGQCGNTCPSDQSCVSGTCSNFCPNQSTGCCACFYTDPTTLHRIYTCTGATVGSCISQSQCEERCQATTPPPGYEHGGVVRICESATSSQIAVCRPFDPDPRFTGVTCGRQTCASTGN